jgi:hypothetical protein
MTAESISRKLASVPDGDEERKHVPFRKKIARTEDRQKRLKIIKAYARLRAELSERILIEALGDPCEIIRDFIIRELSARPAIDFDFLRGRLAAPPWYARSAVLKIVGKRKPEKAVSYIRQVIDDANADVRKCAAQTLGEIGGRETLPLLVKLQKDPNPYVRAAAEEGLIRVSEVRFI